MSDSDEKVIVRMPRRGGLGAAELCEIHIRPGQFVGREQPVVSILADGVRITMTTKQAGVVLPLIGHGDLILPGDPLFTLRPGPEMVETTPREQAGAPLAEKRKLPPLALRLRNWVRRWGWVILALGAYVTAARWVLPQISAWIPPLTHWHWVGILIFLLSAGVGMFRVLSWRGGPREQVFGQSIMAAWVILVTGGIYIQAGGVQALVQDVVTGSRSMATQIATVAYDAIPTVPEPAPAPLPQLNRANAEEPEPEAPRTKPVEGRVVFRLKRTGEKIESSAQRNLLQPSGRESSEP
ncbi:MAG: hypothetical protein AAGC79_01920 [Pseudomonadota bacterium]